MALFRSKNFLDFDMVALSFLFDKYYPILEQLGLKDSSRDLQINCVISYLFLSISNILCICRKIRCDWESCKVLDFWAYLNNSVEDERIVKNKKEGFHLTYVQPKSEWALRGFEPGPGAHVTP